MSTKAIPVAIPVKILPGGSLFLCPAEMSLLEAVRRRPGSPPIPIGCRNGGCGVCRVRVLRGRVRLLGPVSRAQVSVEDEDKGFTLACRAAPEGELEIELAGPEGGLFHRAAMLRTN